MAMNEVFGPVFTTSRAEAATPGHADERSRALASQFIVDCQTHFVRDDYGQQMLIMAARFAKEHWNPALSGVDSLTRFKFQNFVKEIFLDSDTKVALISGHADRRGRADVPEQRPDRRGARRHQPHRRARVARWATAS